MPVFAANLTLMFNEWPFLDRFQAAADAGFTAVEHLFPYDHPPEAIAERLDKAGLTQALFNLPPGDWAAGERGLAALPGRFEAVKAGLAAAMPYIEATGVKRVHLMAGLADPNDPEAKAAWRRALQYVSGPLAERGVDLLIEPINGLDAPGYFLNDFAIAEAAIAELALPNLKLQFDVYHRQILHGDVTRALRNLMPIIGHVQIASVPSRNEPDSEELNYPFLFQVLDLLGYKGHVAANTGPAARRWTACSGCPSRASGRGATRDPRRRRRRGRCGAAEGLKAAPLRAGSGLAPARPPGQEHGHQGQAGGAGQGGRALALHILDIGHRDHGGGEQGDDQDAGPGGEDPHGRDMPRRTGAAKIGPEIGPGQGFVGRQRSPAQGL